MRVAKISLMLFVLVVLGIAGIRIFFKPAADITAWNGSSNTAPMLAERSDDEISYTQEVRTLTARLKRQEEEVREKDKAHQEEINGLRQQLREQASNANNKLGQEVKTLADRNDALNQQNEELRAQMIQMQELLGQMQARQEEMANREPPDVSAQVAAELAKITGKTAEEVRSSDNTDGKKPDDAPRENVFTGLIEDGKHSVNHLLGDDSGKPPALRPGANSDTAGAGGISAPLPGADGRVHFQPYGAVTNGQGNSISNLLNQGGNVFNGNGPGSNTGQNPLAPPGQQQVQTRWPVYTLPVTTMLTGAVTLTPMVGRVPVGGNVHDPFKFQAELGADNLAANGHRIPGVAKVIVAGTVVGNREQECVRGAIQVMTFIFKDGRIHTVGDGANHDSNGGLGYLADPWGKPCIRGTYINNGSEYLTSRATAAFLEGLAGAYGNAQVRRSTDANGFRDTYISGNTYQYAASQGIGSTAAEIAAYVRERAMDAFDVVYVPQAHKVQIILEQQVDIDYDTQARKVSYLRQPQNPGVNHD